MEWVLLVIVGAAVLIVLYGIILYNKLVKSRQMAEEGWSGIDVQLKRRADLIPNLIESVKGYMTQEREVLTQVTEARAAAAKVPGEDVAGRGAAEGLLSGALGRLFAVAEAYPDLKSNQNFLDLQDALESVESEIQMARRYYNGATRNLNVLVESFPSNIVAQKYAFEKKDYFEIESDADRAVPKVAF